MREFWRAVPGYLGLYEVSNNGRVRSISRFKRCVSKKGMEFKIRIRERILKLPINAVGYPQVVLYIGGVGRSIMVHLMVATAFLRRKNSKYEVNHKDGVKHNNHLENLEWVTSSANKYHAYATGLRPVGKKHHFSKLSRNSKGFCIKRI